MLYIRRKLGGRIDAHDGIDEYTRLDRVPMAAVGSDLVAVVVEGKHYLTYPMYIIDLVELYPVRDANGLPLTTLGEYVSDTGDRCDGRDVPVAEAHRFRRYYP